jgi:hypothetical protein
MRSFLTAKAVIPPVDVAPVIIRAKLAMQTGHMAY